jgi:hypothetical protein
VDLLVEDNDDSTKCRLYSFINNVMRKMDSLLICEPPEQPSPKPVLGVSELCPSTSF